MRDHPEYPEVRWKDDYEEEKTTPLIEACKVQDAINPWGYDELYLLLQNGADFSATGNIHFHEDHMFYPPEVSEEILTHVGHARGGFGALDDVFPLFVAAIVHDDESKIKALLSAGADVNQRTAIGQTALHALCAKINRSYFQENKLYPLDNDDDDGYPYPINFKAQTIKTLISYGADINIRDHHGKTPLHYAATFGQMILAKILISNGANVYQKDNAGLDALDYAATENQLMMLFLIDKFCFPITRVIQAYECVASKMSHPIEIFETLRKAALLREQHGIPKTVPPPMECYGFEKEWETMEELERQAENSSIRGSLRYTENGTLFLQCILARERTNIEKNFDIAENDIELLLGRNGQRLKELANNHINHLLRYQLDRFSVFGNYLYFGEIMVMSSMTIYIGYHKLSNDMLVKFAVVAIESCKVIQSRLNIEKKPGCIQELIATMAQNLVMVRVLILHLMQISDQGHGMGYESYDQELKSEVNPRIAKILLNELLHQLPTVSAPFYEYASPLTNILFNGRHKPMYFTLLTTKCLRYNYQFMEIMIESQVDLNATDSNGNTLLHLVITDFAQVLKEIYMHHGDKMPTLIDTTLAIVRILLEKGSYSQAKNKRRKRPIDILHGVEVPDKENIFTERENLASKGRAYNTEEVVTPFMELLEKYDDTFTLKYLVAMKIVDSKIPYTNQLPKALVKFVDLH